MTVLAHYENCTGTALVFPGNAIEDAGAKELAAVLAESTSITTLHLGLGSTIREAQVVEGHSYCSYSMITVLRLGCEVISATTVTVTMHTMKLECTGRQHDQRGRRDIFGRWADLVTDHASLQFGH